MDTETSQLKNGLRQMIRARLENISPAVRAVESVDLCARLEPQLRSAHTILFFAPLADELDVWPLLEKCAAAKKICALPAFNPATQSYAARLLFNPATEIATGKFGVREPQAGCPEISLAEFDLVLVPGVAFDLSGNRLGRGRGFYDRILTETTGVKCGVAYDFQLLEKIPTEPHDATVNFIFTPSRCVKRKNP